MSKNRKRKPHSRKPSPRQTSNHSSIKEIAVTSLSGQTEPMNVLFYKPGRCALCQCKAAETMVGITWEGQTLSDPLACYFCPRCALFWLAYMTQQQQVDFMLAAEMDSSCELAQDSIGESGVAG